MQKLPPLIVTIKLNDEAQVHFNELRSRYYPAYCNYVHAHITLFHKLSSQLTLIDEVLATHALQPSFEMQVNGVINMGSGVAYTLASAQLIETHKKLQKAFKGFLVLKDQKKLWPHITIQNKVTAFKAQQTAELLQQNFKPFTIQAIGFSTYLFKKNRWIYQKDYLFL